MAAKDAVGAHGERVAARALEEAGWRIVARNWRCDQGELDIVAVEGHCLVAVEVKTRRSDAFGGAIEAVTWSKLARLRRLVAAWLVQSGESFPELRIDVMAVTLPQSGRARIEHVRGVE